MKQSRLPTIPRRFALGLSILAMAVVGCGEQDAMAPDAPDQGLNLEIAQAPADKALEVKPTFVASLSGAAAGTESKAAGEAIFRFDEGGTLVRFRLNLANIQNVTMAHIHVAAEAGGNGPPGVWLYPDGPPPTPIPGRTQGSLGIGDFSASDLVGPLAGMTLGDLRTAIVEGRAYVNVHTAQYPVGEIRGTIG